MIFPEGILIDGLSGGMSMETGRYVKRLSDLSNIFRIFRDPGATARQAGAESDPVVYEVVEYKKEGSDLFFGTTTMRPGMVGDEYFMTRGHFHMRRDMGEVYYTQSGEGLLILETRDGQTSIVHMQPGVLAFIPPDWAHRSINTGTQDLVFVWVCNIASGNDYADIAVLGMRKLVVERSGRAEVVDNTERAALPFA